MLKFSVHTLGCKLNRLESDAIAQAFLGAGFKATEVSHAQDAAFDASCAADVVIINTCTVTSKADQKSRAALRKALKDNPCAAVIATGCLANLEDECFKAIDLERLFVFANEKNLNLKGALLRLPFFITENLSENVQNTELGKSTLINTLIAAFKKQQALSSQLECKNSAFAFFPQDNFQNYYYSRSRAYLKIQDGCNNACSYCRARLARGKSLSLDSKTALERLLFFQEKGFSEAVIAGQNISQYNHEGGDLSELLNLFLKNTSKINLRLSSIDPAYISPSFLQVIKHERIRRHFHLSIQSSSDRVLQRMKRSYDSSTLKTVCAALRAAKEDPFLACDIITGFPGETKEDFMQTLHFLEETSFAWIHVFPYSRRQGTEAASFGEVVDQKEIKHRAELLKEVSLNCRKHYAETFIGKKLSAIVEKVEKYSSKGQIRATSENYLKCIVKLQDKNDLFNTGQEISLVPINVLEGADGEKPDVLCRILPFA